MNDGRNDYIAFLQIADAALARVEAILSRWLPGGTIRAGEYVVRNPKRTDRATGSFSINMRTGCWADFATGDRGGDLISLAAYLFDLSQADAAKRLAEMLGESPYEDR